MNGPCIDSKHYPHFLAGEIQEVQYHLSLQKQIHIKWSYHSKFQCTCLRHTEVEGDAGEISLYRQQAEIKRAPSGQVVRELTSDLQLQ